MLHVFHFVIAGVPNPGQGAAPPGSDKVTTLLSWLAWIVTALCVGGVLFAGGKMAISSQPGAATAAAASTPPASAGSSPAASSPAPPPRSPAPCSNQTPDAACVWPPATPKTPGIAETPGPDPATSPRPRSSARS